MLCKYHITLLQYYSRHRNGDILCTYVLYAYYTSFKCTYFIGKIQTVIVSKAHLLYLVTVTVNYKTVRNVTCQNY